MSKIKLCDEKACTQCMACVNACPKGCIQMVDAGLGFAVPQIDESRCVACGACLRACHQLEPPQPRNTPLKTLACWTRVVSDRRRSSSGGAFSVLAHYVLSRQGIVFGATMDPHFQVRHIGITAAEELYRLQGSKYVQSYLGDTFLQVRRQLREGRQVLFTGTPCQVGALLTFLRKPYENLLTCDMVCHGVPSQKAFDAYCERTRLTGTCDRISFRFTEGWGFQLAREWTVPAPAGASGCRVIRRKPLAPSQAWYMRAFNKALLFNEACYSCPYTTVERVSDFTLADYWGLGEKTPFTHPTRQGISMLLVNTSKADQLLKELPALCYEERELQEAIAGNHNLTQSSGRPANREAFIADLMDPNQSSIVRKYGLQASLRDYLRLLKQQTYACLSSRRATDAE